MKNFLTRNRLFLDAVVAALKEKRALTNKDIEQIKANVNIVAYTIAKMSKNYK